MFERSFFVVLQSSLLGLAQVLNQYGLFSYRTRVALSIVALCVSGVPLALQFLVSLGEIVQLCSSYGPLFLRPSCIPGPVFGWPIWFFGTILQAPVYILKILIQRYVLYVFGDYDWIVTSRTVQTGRSTFLKLPKVVLRIISVGYVLILGSNDPFSGKYQAKNISLPIWLCDDEGQRTMMLAGMTTRTIGWERFVTILNRHVDVTNVEVDSSPFQVVGEGKMVSKTIRDVKVMAVFFADPPSGPSSPAPRRSVPRTAMPSSTAMPDREEHSSMWMDEDPDTVPGVDTSALGEGELGLGAVPHQLYTSRRSTLEGAETLTPNAALAERAPAPDTAFSPHGQSPQAPDLDTPSSQSPQVDLQLQFRILLLPTNNRSRGLGSAKDYDGRCELREAIEFFKLIEILDDDAFLVKEMPSSQYGEAFHCETFDAFVEGILWHKKTIMAMYVREAIYL